MEIGKDKVVTLEYVLTVEGNKVDESGDNPLVYLHGHNQMIPGFEKQLEGLAKGSEYKFEVSPEEGYGPKNDQAVIDIDKNIFLIDGVMSTEVFEGAQLVLDDQDGNSHRGVVLEISDNAVKMDFNHPLAGKQLHFEGNIVDVRDASDDEISHGHAHGPGGHEH